MKLYYKLLLYGLIALSVNSIFAYKSSENKPLNADGYFAKAEDFLNKKSNYDSALYYYELAGKEYEEQGKFDKFIDCLNKTAECLYRWNHLDHALIKAHEALGESQANFGEKNIQVAQAYNNIARVYYLRAQYGASFEFFAKAQTLLEQLPTDANQVRAETYGGMGDIFYMLDQYLEARREYKRQADIFKSLPKNHPKNALLNYKFGNIYQKQGHYHLALEAYEKAIQIYEQTVDSKHIALADCFVGIGDIRQHYGSYDLSTEYYYKALTIYHSTFGKLHPQSAGAYLGLAEILKNQGNYNEALHHYRKVVSTYKKTAVGENHPQVADAYLGIGNVHTYRTEYQPALTYYRKVLKINEKLLATHRISTSAAYNNIGGIYYFNGNYEEALKHYEMALAIDKQLHGEKHPDVANAYGNIGQVYAEQGFYDKALEFCQLAICASITDFDKKNIYKNPILRNYFDQNDLLWYLQFKAQTLEKIFIQNKNVLGLEISLQTYQLCDSLIDKIRLSHTSKEDKIELGKNASQIYAGATKTAFELHQILTLKDVEHDSVTFQKRRKYFLDEIFYFSEKNKAGVLAASIVETNAKEFGGIPPNLLAKEISLRKEIADYRKELAKKPDSTMVIFYQEQLFEANRKYRELIEKFEIEYPKYHELKHNLHPISADKIREKLDEKTAMISYFFTNDEIYIIVLTKDAIKVKQVLNNAPIKKAIRRMRNAIFYQVAKIFVESTYEIYSQIFPQLSDSIQNVIIIPDGVALTIPFEGLLHHIPNNEIITQKDFSQFPYLIQKLNISYAVSGNLFYQTFFGSKSVKRSTKDWIGIAPVFTQNSMVNETAIQILSNLDKQSSQGGGLFRDGAITPIPATETEIHTIADKLSSKNRKIDKILHSAAQESFIKKGGLKNYRFLHIATHGFANSEQPELSGILLVPDSLEDGILYSGEIYNLDLNADLTVLSACETGLGKISKGEGVIGLTRALFYAGTKNIMVSLWKVSDESTSQLMIHFYENLAEYDTNSEAFAQVIFNFSNPLRTAKLQLIQEKKFANPYYWSPFILIGK